MIKYIASIAVAALLLGIALRSRGAVDTNESADGPAMEQGEVVAGGERPLVDAVPGPEGGHRFTVRHRLAGAVSRATLVYDTPDGETRTAATQTDCNKALDAADSADGYVAHVNLTGLIPADAVRARLVLEDDTGTRVFVLDRG